MSGLSAREEGTLFYYPLLQSGARQILQARPSQIIEKERAYHLVYDPHVLVIASYFHPGAKDNTIYILTVYRKSGGHNLRFLRRRSSEDCGNRDAAAILKGLYENAKRKVEGAKRTRVRKLEGALAAAE